jgi:16S rRNA (uracil1498-N3)-methyltransferase
VERSTDLSLGMIPLPAGPDESIMITIGPEGGWNQEELLLARGQGYRTISLGSRILRAETAAVAAVSILQSRLGELG